MNAIVTLLLLLAAAALEAGGDALCRIGVRNQTGLAQAVYLACGGGMLLGYGVFVNLAPTDFGRSLGIYVAVFFVVAQVINLVAFGVRPGISLVAGGTLIVAGGVVMTFWRA
jgi:small multidrug resistance family-3 protein